MNLISLVHLVVFVILFQRVSSDTEDVETIVDVNYPRSIDWRSPLMVASRMGDIEKVRSLINTGLPDVNMRDMDGETALMLASAAGSVDIVQELLNHGANVNMRSNWGRTALSLAAHGRYSDVGARMEIGHTAVVTLLLENEADVHSVEKFNWTATHIACFRGNTAIVSKLIEYGADVNLEAGNERDCFALAVTQNEPDTVRVLLETYVG